ncbi:MAG: thiamine pyrophosphate-dependent enzyme [Terracidiphilus sp.]
MMTARDTRQKPAEPTNAPGGQNGFSLISSGKLIELYAAMVKSRMVAERARLLKQKGVLASDLDGSLGREAAVAGVGVDLLAEDTLSLSRCDLVSTVIKGMALDRIFLGLASQGNGRAHLPARLRSDAKANGTEPDLDLDARLDAACRAATAHKAANNCRIVVVSCGDGATSIGSWREALTNAGLHELPIVFVWHNDTGDAQESLMGQNDFREAASRTTDRSVPAITVDGGDAVAVYRVASESIDRARRLRGPTVIECRRRGSNEWVKTAKGRKNEGNDPIDAMETYLIGKGLFNPGMRRNIAMAFNRELDLATRFLDR